MSFQVMGIFRFPLSLSPLILWTIWFWLAHLLPNGGFNNHKRYISSRLLLFCWYWISIHAIHEASESSALWLSFAVFDVLKKLHSFWIFLHSSLFSIVNEFFFVIWTKRNLIVIFVRQIWPLNGIVRYAQSILSRWSLYRFILVSPLCCNCVSLVYGAMNFNGF